MEVTISRFKLAGTLFYFNCRWFDTYFEVDLSDGKYVWQGNGKIQLDFARINFLIFYKPRENILKRNLSRKAWIFQNTLLWSKRLSPFKIYPKKSSRMVFKKEKLVIS